MVGIVGAFVGGFLVSSILGFHYTEGFNLSSIVVATEAPSFFSPSSVASRTVALDLIAELSDGADTYILCEINVSSVYPFPDDALGPLAAETLARIERRR